MPYAEVARLGDTGSGICNGHSGGSRQVTVTFTGNGDSKTSVNGQSLCTVGTVGLASCGHTTVATTGTVSILTVDGFGLHRVGDQGDILDGSNVVGSYTVTSGSTTVLANT